MELPQPSPEGTRQRLQAIREIVLLLHKALLDSERTSYEILHGPLVSPAAFLQLLISDNRFAWVQPITKLIVQVDETLAARKPPAADRELEHLIEDTRSLFSPSREADEFWKHYHNAVQRDPAVAVLQGQLEQLLGQNHRS